MREGQGGGPERRGPATGPQDLVVLEPEPSAGSEGTEGPCASPTTASAPAHPIFGQLP